MSLRHLSKWWWGLGVVLGLMGAPAAEAGNAISGISFKKYENLTTAGIKAIVQGDDDSSAVLRLEITTHDEYAARGTAAFDSSMVMTRRQVQDAGGGNDAASGNIYEGSLIWLVPGQTYYWRCVYTDAGGGGGTSAIDSVTTKSIPSSDLNTKAITRYVGKNGNDSWDASQPTYGGGVVGPKLTIAAGLAALDALADDGANGAVVVGPGVYREKININFGTDTPGVRRYLIYDGVAPDSTIIDGSWGEPWETGQTWVALNSGSADSTWYALVGGTLGSADSISNIVINHDEYIHRKTTKQEIFDNGMGEASGWFVNGDTLFIKRRTGQSPAGTQVHAGYQWTQNSLVQVRKRNWVIKGFTFRFAGGTTGTSNHAVEVATTGVKASGLIIDSCKFIASSGRSVYLPIWAASGGADSVMVARSYFSGRGVGQMTYQAAKARQEENSDRLQLQSGLATIWNNTVDNVSNGPTVTGGENDSVSASNYEVSYNTVRYVSDDALELDTGHAINSVAYKNNIDKVLTGISFTGVYSGPLYVLYNTINRHSFAGGGRGLKIGGLNGNGKVLIYHNTVSAKVAAGGTAFEAVALPAEQMTFRNNILVLSGAGAGNYVIGGSTATNVTDNSFNYNLLDSLNVQRLARWAATDYSSGVSPLTSTWQSTRAWDRNGPGRASPAFQDSANNNFRLQSGSAAVDAGMRIAGVNTDYRGNRYTVLPDIGAMERNWPRRRSWFSRLIGVSR